jgi:hypothetical protein
MAAPYRHRMRRPRASPRLAAAWLVTGPIGHLYAAVIDWACILARYVRARGRWDRM